MIQKVFDLNLGYNYKKVRKNLVAVLPIYLADFLKRRRKGGERFIWYILYRKRFDDVL
jgi:hypothetical protein